MGKVYVVNWDREETFVFKNKEDAIEKVEEITGVCERDWSFDNGDTDDDGRSVWYQEAEEQY